MSAPLGGLLYNRVFRDVYDVLVFFSGTKTSPNPYTARDRQSPIVCKCKSSDGYELVFATPRSFLGRYLSNTFPSHPSIHLCALITYRSLGHSVWTLNQTVSDHYTFSSRPVGIRQTWTPLSMLSMNPYEIQRPIESLFSNEPSNSRVLASNLYITKTH